MINNVIGRDLTDEIKKELGSCDFAVTDENVARLYPELTRGAYVIRAGENNKNRDTLFCILEKMCEARCKRDSRIAAIGGGVVGDITGLAAALYMRGIKWLSIPTTLLAMVDSGIGGKTAIDFCGRKNLVGAFHSPEKTVISTHFLDTLDDREWLCGTGEIIKTCLLDKTAYKLFAKKKDSLIKRTCDAYDFVDECVRIKSRITELDPTENGLRKILNVGHTVGHAYESADGYKLSHGEYVITGMLIETEMNKDIVDETFYGEIMPTLKKLARIPDTFACGLEAVKYAASDKKNTGDTVSIMAVVSPGNITEVKLDENAFAKRFDEAMGGLK